MCAGVIGATINNSIGIAGIAPGCRIMDVRYPLGHSDVLGVSGKLSNCIDWAWNNGAWVISNSWSNGATDLVREAIDDAIDKGRNGLGCVVVFASGNNNLSSIPQPNAHNSDALVVGASNSLGHRIGLGEWNNGKNQTQASNYGTKLDVMAPGINIQTTNVTASSGELYVGKFEGTSAACPHAAGVAALVLSFKPYLTQHEVVDIIEMTATKMSGYTYTNTSGRTNGTWNVYTGYGLLNAYNALLLAEQYNSYLYTYLYNKVYSSNLLFSTDEMVYTGNIVVNNNASVNIQAEDGFIINQDLVVNTGCSLSLYNN
jgi:subtilisin family serine protease